MAANPFQPPRELTTRSSGAPDRMLIVLGGVFAGLNLLTFLSLGIREILVYFDPLPSLALYLGGFVAGMVLIPVLSRGQRDVKSAPTWTACVAAALIILELTWLFNVFVGAFCRGPNWNFYWPWEERDPFRVVIMNNVDLSQYFWYRLGFESRPEFGLLRESPGLVLLALWLIAVPIAITRLLRARFPHRVPGYWRLLAVTFLVQWMALLPLKMVLRPLLNLKYLVSFPETMLNV